MKDAYYFPHFCNARSDRKIRRAMKELGIEGYGIFFLLLEVLRDQADYKFPIKDIDLLADEFGTSEQKVRTVICNYELFELDANEMFFSSNMIMYLQPYLENKERKRIAGIRGNLIRHKHITKEESGRMNDHEILNIYDTLALRPLSDRNKRKEKESKVKEKKEIYAQIESAFNEYWSNVQRKVDKKKAKDKFTTLWKRNKLPSMQVLIEKLHLMQKASEVQYQPHPTTWLNGHRWEDELQTAQKEPESKPVDYREGWDD